MWVTKDTRDTINNVLIIWNFKISNFLGIASFQVESVGLAEDLTWPNYVDLTGVADRRRLDSWFVATYFKSAFKIDFWALESKTSLIYWTRHNCFVNRHHEFMIDKNLYPKGTFNHPEKYGNIYTVSRKPPADIGVLSSWRIVSQHLCIIVAFKIIYLSNTIDA